MAMDRGHITRTVHTARTADPGWDGRHLRGVRIRLWLAVGLLVVGPLSVVAGLVAVSAVSAGEWVMPLVLQLGIAVAGGLLALGLAGPLGWYLARGAAGQGDASASVMVVGWVRLLVVLGLVCPPAVIGLGFSNIAVVPPGWPPDAARLADGRGDRHGGSPPHCHLGDGDGLARGGGDR